MNVVVFGCDNTGKTTLCEQLTEYLDQVMSTKYVHSLGPVSVDKMIEFMETEMVDKDAEEIKIFDRFPIIEEEVYGTILRGKSKFTDEEYKKSKLDNVDVFIYCYPGLFTTTKWGDREQMDGVKDNVLDIINAYNKLAITLKENGYNVKEYNFKCDNYMKLMEVGMTPEGFDF